MTTSTTAVWSQEGYLNWNGGERRSDRYGSVSLCPEKWGDVAKIVGAPVGLRCRLVATVLESSTPEHVGDLFRGIYPAPEGTPVGTEVVLGEGRVFTQDYEGDPDCYIGLTPADGRNTDWLDPRALYAIHAHRVRLELLPADPES